MSWYNGVAEDSGTFLTYGAVVGSEVTDISNKSSAFSFSVKQYKKNDLKFLTLKTPGYFETPDRARKHRRLTRIE